MSTEPRCLAGFEIYRTNTAAGETRLCRPSCKLRVATGSVRSVIRLSLVRSWGSMGRVKGRCPGNIQTLLNQTQSGVTIV